MSYCRFGWDGSDVYVYLGSEGYECCGCTLTDARFVTDGNKPEEMIAHLGKHRRAGHFVPDYAIVALWEEIPGAHRPSSPENGIFVALKMEGDAATLTMRANEIRDKLKTEVNS